MATMDENQWPLLAEHPLIIDQLTKDFGIKPEKGKKQKREISKNEEVILTLIARVIVEIIIREEL